MSVRILTGDCRAMLATLPAESVHCVVTSPPYFGLRDYGTAKWEGGGEDCDHKQGRKGSGRADGIVDERGQRNRDGVGSMGGDCSKCGARRIDSQIGLEPTPDAFVAAMVEVFREVRRVLRRDGTLWLNLGDSYGAIGGNTALGLREAAFGKGNARGHAIDARTAMQSHQIETGLRPKNLLGIPWRVAFALQADGWWLRQDIIWHKPNPMPESVRDRCTKAHEYLFLLTKSERYFYDAEAVSEPIVRQWDQSNGSIGRNGLATESGGQNNPTVGKCTENRNRRSVWTITTQPFSEAHFATFPPELPELCIKAGCPPQGTVLDPFGGAGTTALVADRLGRNAILIELNPDYAAMAQKRLEGDAGLFASVAAE